MLTKEKVNEIILNERIETILLGLKIECKDKIKTSVWFELRTKIIPKCINIHHNIYTNYSNVISEILHIVAGYIGRNLDDKQFEIFLGWVDENVSLVEYMNVLGSYLVNAKLTESECVMNIIKRYCDEMDISIDIFNLYYSKVINDFAVTDYTNGLIFNIINTSQYIGGMGTLIIHCDSHMALSDYGFDDNELKEIAKMNVGDTFVSHDYGKGCILVRAK